MLCNDDYIQDLNAQWRGKDAPTDVLSFPQEADNGVLGDLVLSIDTAQRQVRAPAARLQHACGRED